MITDIGSVPILVSDAKKAARWYEKKLGFEIVNRRGHFVTVRPKNSTTLLHLCERCGEWAGDSPGGQTGVWFKSGEGTCLKGTESLIPHSSPEDLEKTYVELKKRGVEFSKGLSTTPYGKYAVFKDLDGNEFYIW